MKEEVDVEALKQVNEILDKHGVEYWLDAGGVVRCD